MSQQITISWQTASHIAVAFNRCHLQSNLEHEVMIEDIQVMHEEPTVDIPYLRTKGANLPDSKLSFDFSGHDANYTGRWEGYKFDKV